MGSSSDSFLDHQMRGVFPSEQFSAVAEDDVADGEVVRLAQVTIEASDGQQYERQVIRHPGAVGIVAVDSDNRVCLVRQFRAAVDGETWEIPAGKKDVPNELGIDTARRELAEEAGFVAGTLRPLPGVLVAPGITDEYGELFLATDLTETDPNLQGPEELKMVKEMVELETALEYVTDGLIADSKTIVGLFLADRFLSDD